MVHRVGSRVPRESSQLFQGVYEIKTLFMSILIYNLPKEGKRIIEGINELVDYLNIRSKEGSKLIPYCLAVSTKLSNMVFDVLSEKSWARCYC